MSPMLNRDDCVELEVEEPVRQRTSKAILVKYCGEEHWIPQSQIHEDSEVYAEGHTGTLIVSRWIAEQKGLV
jgi:hypothetical protein